MEFSRQKLPFFFFFVLLLVTTEMGGMVMVAEARHCESQSHRFKGMCVRGSNCANVCQTEGFPDGLCKTEGIHRRCFCRKFC
ncbi:defensin Ec-AMP-D1-like [Ananas comosus]|uniref:Defensin Ec-AMP-D1-like n=1 Tax=Ananas comosus TaxID=4615 RepID=A0A6P5FF50_ANACO|nr:defensin Ec-AMP-D1-like [Ananas comosus]